jgi:hypothetical protein
MRHVRWKEASVSRAKLISLTADLSNSSTLYHIADLVDAGMAMR